MVRARLLIMAVAVSVSAVLFCALSSSARADYTVYACGSYPNGVFQGYNTSAGTAVGAECPQGAYNAHGIFAEPGSVAAPSGAAGRVQANAPAGLELTGASIGQYAGYGVNDGGGWGGGFYWGGGGFNVNDSTPQNPNFGWVFAAPSRYFGLQLVCGKASCSEPAEIDAGSIALYVRETQGPTFSATGLWQTSGWVRGTWPFTASSDSPSGACTLSAALNGDTVASSTTTSQNNTVWKQCPGEAINQPIDTTRFGNGAMPLVLFSQDASNVPAGLTQTVYVDNTAPTISLSGPADAPSTAGTQYVTATASAGPSGVDGISCSVDNAPAQWYPGATAQVPISGVGEHQVSCAAANNAVDASGNNGWSDSASWSMKIGDPTINGITFGHVVDTLRCRRVQERVKIRAHWVTIRRHHQRIKVRRRARFITKKVTKCHPRTAIRRVVVRIRVRRHGKDIWVKRRERERVVLLPHHKNSYSLRVGHGKPATVSGWLGNYAGVALSSQPITVVTAPNNGLGQFTAAAVATTSATGWWGVKLPAGPSRLVQAVYGGSPTTEGSVSNQIALTVPAKIRLLSVSPHKVAWGGTVRLVGELYDGYLPTGGALVRLRIGEGSAQTTYGVREHVGGNGRFTTTYTFGQGVASIHRAYWFQLASLPTGNYPYAPAASRKLTVDVGGHPQQQHHLHH